MFRKTDLPLSKDEIVIEIIHPVKVHRFVRSVIGFLIVSINSFFTFWLWQHGLEGQVYYCVALLLGLYLLFYDILFDKSNYLVVTNQRVFDVHRESLFSQTVSSLSFLELVEVVVVRRGFFPTVLNYGHLTLHPKDGSFVLEFQRIPKPMAVQTLLFENRDKAKRVGRLGSKDEILKQFIKLVPDLSEAELTLLYQKIHTQLISLAEQTSEKTE
jgi:hypothetical protein